MMGQWFKVKTYQYNNLTFQKKDGLLIGVLLIFTILMVVRIFTYTPAESQFAIVYLNGEKIDVLDLSVDQHVTYNGKLGPVVVEVKDHRVAVIKETSPQNLCSLQGFVDSVLTPIICLPNELIIEIHGGQTTNELDVIQ